MPLKIVSGFVEIGEIRKSHLLYTIFFILIIHLLLFYYKPKEILYATELPDEWLVTLNYCLCCVKVYHCIGTSSVEKRHKSVLSLVYVNCGNSHSNLLFVKLVIDTKHHKMPAVWFATNNVRIESIVCLRLLLLSILLHKLVLKIKKNTPFTPFD